MCRRDGQIELQLLLEMACGLNINAKRRNGKNAFLSIALDVQNKPRWQSCSRQKGP